MDATQEIKARLPIEELVGQYVQVQKKGRNFVSLCPFHNDTHPSLLISPDKGIAYCFACQTGGDIFSFYQSVENVDFRQALKDLAEKAGVELPQDQKFQAGPKKDEKDRMRECMQEAADFYMNKLNENETAKNYATERKLTPELIEKFCIGYAPDSFDATYTHLLKKGFSKSEILGAGLGIQKDLQQERIYDRFRNRIIFPIHNTQGNIIGFGGRTIGQDDAKYINSPDGPLYNKSNALFGLSYAKESVRKSKKVVLVEGYFDVIACHRIGIENVVAVSGTALTEQHATILRRYADRVCLCLDQDPAGVEAERRSFLLCKAQDLDVRTIDIPAGKDPDECAGLVPDEMKKQFSEDGIPYFDATIKKLKKSDMEKREMLKYILPLLNGIPSSVEREEAIVKTAELLGTTVTALKDDMQKEKQLQEKQVEKQFQTVESPFGSADLFLGLLLTYPSHIKLIDRLLEPEEEMSKKLYKMIKRDANQSNQEEEGSSGLDSGSKEPAEEAKESEVRERASVLQLYCEEHFGEWPKELAEKELKKLYQKVNRDLLLGKQKRLIEDIRNARSSGKTVEEEQLLTQYQQVLKLTQIAS